MSDEALLTMREAADLIGMSYDWLRKQAAAQLVPCYRFGASVRFSQAQVEAIKAAALQAPIPTSPSTIRRLAILPPGTPPPSPPPPQPPNPGGPTNPPRRRRAA